MGIKKRLEKENTKKQLEFKEKCELVENVIKLGKELQDVKSDLYSANCLVSDYIESDRINKNITKTQKNMEIKKL